MSGFLGRFDQPSGASGSRRENGFDAVGALHVAKADMHEAIWEIVHWIPPKSVVLMCPRLVLLACSERVSLVFMQTSMELLFRFPNILHSICLVSNDVDSVHSFLLDCVRMVLPAKLALARHKAAVLETAVSADSTTGACSAENELHASSQHHHCRTWYFVIQSSVMPRFGLGLPSTNR